MKPNRLMWIVGVLLFSIFVSSVTAAPVAGFSGTPASGSAPLAVAFTDGSTGSPTGWAWFFGDETYVTPWTLVNASSGWTARWGHSSVAMPDGSIVLMGGYDGITGIKNDVWRSTDNGFTWTRMTASAGWTARAYPSSVAMPDGSIVLMGGDDVPGPAYKNDVWRSTDNGATWTNITTSGGWSARATHSSVVMPDGSVVLMGGNSASGYKNDTWRSTDNGTTWTQVNLSSGWSARYSHTSVAMPDGSIVLMGGWNGGNWKDVWRSTDIGATWTQMTAGAGWSARRSHTSVAMTDGSIVLMGGYDGTRYNDTWRSTDNGATWTNITTSGGWLARNRHTSVAMPDGSIVLMGGLGAANDVWRLNPVGSSTQNPLHTFTTAGNYNVSLQVYNAGGYNSTRKTGYITVTGSSLLVANFTTDITSGLKPLTVKFTDISTGNPTTVNMSFGDAAWANTTGPWVHTYMNEGTFFPVIYASDGITNSSGTNATISVNVTTGLDTGLAKAYNAVLNNATILNGTATGKSISASLVQIPAGSPIQRWGGKPAITAPTTGWLIFIDDYPGANWEHPCRYVFVDVNGKTTLVTALSPPTNINLKQIAGMVPGPGGDANSVTSASQNPGGGLGTLNLQPACTGPDCSRNYALLISGGFNTRQNHLRYWNDISFMYQTLNQTYGYPADHITVLMSDGTGPAADRHNATAANGDILTDNSPVNLDVIYGSTDVTGDAKKGTVLTTLSTLNSRLTPADSLFIFTTSHGGWDNVPNSNNSLLYLWNEEYITDTDFVAALPATPGNITMVMEQCYSGGFVDNFIDKYSGSQRRVIATASNGNEPSWGNGFSNAWTSGVARIDEARLPNFRADINMDNKISIWEAYNYSLTYDPFATPSLAVHEHPQYSARNPANAGTTQYLSTCPAALTLTVTGPTNIETWYMGYPRSISWTQTGLDSTTVSISLWNRTPGVKQLDIATNIPASPGIYTWTIPTSLAAGNDYRVNISSVAVPTSIVYDQSNSPFILAKYAVPGFITVNSAPSGAGVYLDGYNLSKKTNVTITGISPGSHNVTVKLAGYYEQDSGIIVNPGKTSILNFTLESTGTNEPPYGTMIITSTPPAAEVVINGMATGLMTPYRKELDPGTYAVTVKANNYTTPAIQSVTVVKGKLVSADFTLVLLPAVKPLPGYASPPTDPDHDGIYEDLNGNGRLDFADVVLYFNQMEWISANEPVSAFDLNGNKRIDFADIVKLFGEI